VLRVKDVLLERLTGEPSAWATIVRHLVPIVGVLLLDWSALETLVALFLDAWSVVLCLAAVAATFVMRGFVFEEMDLADWANVVTGGLVLFVLVGALLGFALAVPASMLLGVVAGHDGAALWSLLQAPGLYATFASMLAFQVPRYWSMATRLDDAAARRVVELEVGFVLVRSIWIAMAGLAFGVLPAGASVLGALIVAQLVLALTEILSDRMLLAIAARG
jgi:hypothetical protein